MASRRFEIGDRLEIQDLVVRYCIAVDDRDLETVCDLFTPDGQLLAIGSPPTGRTEIGHYYATRLKNYGMTYHYTHGMTVEPVRNDEAKGIVLGHAEICLNGELFLVAMRYYDRYVRYGGNWLFAERDLRQFYALPHRELSDGVANENRVRWPGSEPRRAILPESVATWERFVGEGHA